MKHPAPGSLRRRVLDYIQAHSLLLPEETVLVGVSGGPDSVCLAHLLAGLQDELRIRLHLAHLNHQLRGPDAEADAEYVSGLAQRLGLPITVHSQDVAAYKARRRLSLETAARQVRYGFFARLARSLGAGRVAVGHTADDQVETILLHLVRGTGMRGLKGMAPLSPAPLPTHPTLWVARPLLEVSREETEAYCLAYDLRPRQDISNYSAAHLRNRLRHELLPLLETFNPAIREGLLRQARTMAEDMAFLEGEVGEAWGQVVQEGAESLALDREQFSRLPSALKRHLLLRALEKLRGKPGDIEYGHIEGMVAALAGPAGARLSLPWGIELWVDYHQAHLSREGAEPCPYPPLEGEYHLVVPGETRVSGWQVVASLLPPPHSFPQEPLIAHLDLRVAQGGLWVRSRRPGDRIHPLGMAVEKKLQDLMVDAHIPRGWRDRVPLVGSGRDILWVVGYRLAQTAAVPQATPQVLRLEFRRS